ncbi:rhombosortase [Permianibacter sp. IMCC34836]|uniref:rhombosortase n=1 Tax=Permianibacter fluminis TaxID=2738515 RepID=UPI0015531825|nr:rhombosortase [Permianibacter fluminis]NQD35692.1 rhombosortase [Permianibacter fluminis]
MIKLTSTTLPARLRVPVVTLACVALMLALQYLVRDHSQFYFDQTAISNGDYWRLLTGHFIHADNAHLRWNLVALLLLGLLLEQHSRTLMLAALVGGVFVIDIWLLSPLAGVSRYCGLSGVLNSVLVLLLWQEWRRHKQWLPVLTGLLALAKIVVELTAQQSLFTHFSWPPYPPAHLAGSVAGLILIAVVHHRSHVSRFTTSTSPTSPTSPTSHKQFHAN